MEDLILEACVDSVASAIAAQNNGAHQLELCSRLDLDGLTPGIDLLVAVKAAVSIPVKVMLRNRGGDFVYSILDFETMKSQLSSMLDIGVDGIVFGALTRSGEIDITLTNTVCNLTDNIPVTFHKAIDSTRDLLESTRLLLDTGVTSILSSGGECTASEGAEVLKNMLEIANKKIDIISAGKITRSNLELLHQRVGGKYYHGKKIVS